MARKKAADSKPEPASSKLEQASKRWIEFHLWLERVLDKTPYFRGHFDIAHTDAMRPRIGRTDWLRVYSRSAEEDMLKAFRREARRYEPGSGYNYWDWVVLAQHFGLPTRLLDWTRNPYVAAYFAVIGAESYPTPPYTNGPRTAEVIAVNWEQQFDLRDYDDQGSGDSLKQLMADGGVAVLKRPPIRTLRVVNQRSIFTVHGEPDKNFTLEHKSVAAFDRFKIEEEYWPYFESRLTHFGFDRAFIDDSIEGVAKAIRVRARLSSRLD